MHGSSQNGLEVVLEPHKGCAPFCLEPTIWNFFIDGAVNQNNFAYYRRIFKNLTNPNGCQVHGTFFLLHDYNNYHNIMNLRHDGHEMAVSSISDDKNLYLKNSTAWTDELAG